MIARSSDESGFTLVELMIAVSILGMIIAVLGAGFSFALNAMDETSDRIMGSNDARLLSVYLPRDAARATEATIGTNEGCTDATDAKLQLRDDYGFNVVYGAWTPAEDSHQLVRYDCSSTTHTSTVVARNLEDTSDLEVEATQILTDGKLTGASLTLTEKSTSGEPPYVFTVVGSTMVTP